MQTKKNPMTATSVAQSGMPPLITLTEAQRGQQSCPTACRMGIGGACWKFGGGKLLLAKPAVPTGGTDGI